MTRLDKAIRRELIVRDKSYTLVIDSVRMKLTRKGRRSGIELTWSDIVSGDAALATALSASVGRL
jgi:hypothetical protein